MAASAWVPYNTFKKKLGQGNVDLSGGVFYMSLFTSASNAATATLSAISQVTNEVAEANGYSSSGKTASANTWSTGASASEYRFDSTAVVWNASGGSISAIKYAVVRQSGGALVCYSQLSTSQFSVTTGNSLTITPSANGVFELN